MTNLTTVLLLQLAGGCLGLLSAVHRSGVASSRGLPPRAGRIAAISILKPLAGLDLGLEANLRTFVEQDYSAFEIMFAVWQAADPAVEVLVSFL